MDRHLLRTFVEVYRLRHFGHAAKSLHITQAAVSARIKQLESLVGTQLFDRSQREVRVTPQGHRFLHHADTILAEMRKASYSFANGDGAEIPQLTIAGSLRLWNIFLQEGWLHKLRRRRPDLAITAEIGVPEALITRLFEGLIDVAVMLEPPQVAGMKASKLTQIDLCLVSTTAGESVQSALGPNYIMIDWGQAFELECRQEFPNMMPPMTAVSNSGMALDYLLALGGAAYIPARVIGRQLELGTLHLVEGAPVFSRDVFGVYLAQNHRVSLIKEALKAFDNTKKAVNH
jgi:LysR family transcriptional regulator, flagellar master operon regulator